jgi:hypothetical protein
MSKKPFSKESEQKILAALEEVTGELARGLSPNDAILKVATDRQMIPGHVRMMCHAVNVGQTTIHRLNSPDTGTKAASFPLADPEWVVGQMFPDQEPADESHKTAVSAEYSEAPPWFASKAAALRRQLGAALLKESACSGSPKKDKMPIRTPETVITRLRDMDRKAGSYREAIHGIYEKAAASQEKLAAYFQQQIHIPLERARKDAEFLFGKSGEAALSCVTGEARGLRVQHDEPVRPDRSPYRYVDELLHLADELADKKAAYQDFLATINKEAAELLAPFRQPTWQTGDVLTTSSAVETTKEAAGLSSLLMNGLGLARLSQMSRDFGQRMPDSSALADKTLNELSDPYHESVLRSLRSEALLHDLMSNDEVIRGHAIPEVVGSYNEISELAPYAVTNKAIMRDLLRKRLSGGPQALDQFTIGDVLRQQDTLRSLQQPGPAMTQRKEVPGGGSVLPDRH